jgi:hypothetical protein
MKIFYCSECEDVRKPDLLRERTSCNCGKSWMEFVDDDYHVRYGGCAVPLGFDNPTFRRAIVKRPVEDGPGFSFIAFVIPEQCPTCRRECP